MSQLKTWLPVELFSILAEASKMLMPFAIHRASGCCGRLENHLVGVCNQPLISVMDRWSLLPNVICWLPQQSGRPRDHCRSIHHTTRDCPRVRSGSQPCSGSQFPFDASDRQYTVTPCAVAPTSTRPPRPRRGRVQPVDFFPGSTRGFGCSIYVSIFSCRLPLSGCKNLPDSGTRARTSRRNETDRKTESRRVMINPPPTDPIVAVSERKPSATTVSVIASVGGKHVADIVINRIVLEIRRRNTRPGSACR